MMENIFKSTAMGQGKSFRHVWEGRICNSASKDEIVVEKKRYKETDENNGCGGVMMKAKADGK